MYKKLRALILVVPVLPVLLISLLILSCGEDDSQKTQAQYPYGNYQQQYPYGNYPTTNYNPSGNYYPTPNTFPTTNNQWPNSYPQFPNNNVNPGAGVKYDYSGKQMCGNGMYVDCPMGFYCKLYTPPPGVYTFASSGTCERR